MIDWESNENPYKRKIDKLGILIEAWEKNIISFEEKTNFSKPYDIICAWIGLNKLKDILEEE